MNPWYELPSGFLGNNSRRVARTESNRTVRLGVLSQAIRIAPNARIHADHAHPPVSKATKTQGEINSLMAFRRSGR